MAGDVSTADRRAEALDRLLDVIADFLVEEYLEEIERGEQEEAGGDL